MAAAKAVVGATDKFDNTPLHLAAARGRTQTARALISAGAAVGVMDNVGRTPLHRAAAATAMFPLRGLRRKRGSTDLVSQSFNKRRIEALGQTGSPSPTSIVDTELDIDDMFDDVAAAAAFAALTASAASAIVATSPV